MMFSNQALKKLIIPLVIEQLLVILVGFCDTIMVSSVGEAAVSAVSLVDSINVLLINVFAALGTGGAVVAAQFIGQGSLEKARFSAKQLLLITAILSLIIMGVILLFNTSILHLAFGNVPRVEQNSTLQNQGQPHCHVQGSQPPDLAATSTSSLALNASREMSDTRM